MSHHKLREDKNCQNCGYVVRKRFCPKCGQENIETRQSFHYLFTHFIEDLVHYEGSFWKTLKNLLLKPGILTREYLKGKRKEYVAPVKLYIFISFFVFFVGGIINTFTTKSDLENVNFTVTNQVSEPQNLFNDSLNSSLSNNEEQWAIVTSEKTLREYDSIQNSLSESLKDKGLERAVKRKEIELKQKYTFRELAQEIKELAQKNIPKFLFMYMPFFAFFMWLFHSKKKWYYFEHGIFTLHYFSFLLLSFFISISIINSISAYFDNKITDALSVLANIVIYLWMFIYFFKAHRKVYNYSKISTIFRGLFLLFLNMTFLIFGIILYIFIIFYLI